MMESSKGAKMLTTGKTRAHRYESGEIAEVEEVLTAEAALQIRVNGIPFTTTLRTPGNDENLVRGILYSEAIVTDPSADMLLATILDQETGTTACIDVKVDPNYVEGDFTGRRALIATSSCGLCGTRELKDLEILGTPVSLRECRPFDLKHLAPMIERMHSEQITFNASGGCHGAAAFADDGVILVTREDVGRHNAVDKVLGALIAAGTLNQASIMLVSGRISYEIVMKTYRAAIPILLAVSAPSSFAVESANRFGMTLVGFCREQRATVYTHHERILQCEKKH
jgi:FdhD protein